MSPNNLCRACLRADQTMSSVLESIVPKADSPPDCVVDLWKIFTNILVVSSHRPEYISSSIVLFKESKKRDAEDSLPDKICTGCIVEIQRTYSFMQKCEGSKDALKKMKNDSSENIKSENDIYAISQIKTESIESIQNGEDDVTQSDYTLTIQKEDNNFAIEILDHLNCENVKVHEAIQHIKQEPELNISTESDEFDAIESEDQSTAQIIRCPGCRFEGSTESMEKHIIDNHMKGQTCKLCNQEFECSPIEHSSKHPPKSIHHTGDGKFKCQSCPKTFRHKLNLIEHLRVHTGERPFKCEICSETFRLKIRLTEHLRQHTGERPFKCESCLKSFQRKHHLLEHSSSHTGVRAFNCQYCPKTFRHKRNLIGHLRFHTGERPFECEICSKTFSFKQSLIYHFRSHTGERPYKCDSCQKSFRCKQHLNVHLKRHTGVRTFKCEICLKTFKSKTSLGNHSRYHKEKPCKQDT